MIAMIEENIILSPISEKEYKHNIEILQKQEPQLTIDQVEYLEMVRDFHQYQTWVWI
jgi:hypothetical protein